MSYVERRIVTTEQTGLRTILSKQVKLKNI